MEYEDTFVTDGEEVCEKKHGRTWDVLFRVHFGTSMNGFTEPQERFTVCHHRTGRYRPQYTGNTVISCQTSPCHDTNGHNVCLKDTPTLQNEVTQNNKPVYKSLLPLRFPSNTLLHISYCVYMDVCL
jgi:hypothetical protein